MTINGNEEDVETGTSVSALIARFNLQPKHVAVEINLELVPRSTFDATVINEGDRIEIVTLVGGG